MADVTADELRQALNAVDFPLRKEQLVDCVEAGSASAAVVRAVRALPLSDYASVDEVVRSVDTVNAGDG